MKKAKNYPLMWVEFYDHASGARWKDFVDIDLKAERVLCQAVGWKVKEDRHHLVLANFRDGDDSSHARTLIVKGAITRKAYLGR